MDQDAAEEGCVSHSGSEDEGEGDKRKARKHEFYELTEEEDQSTDWERVKVKRGVIEP